MKQLKLILAFLFGLTVIGAMLIGGVTVAKFSGGASSPENGFISGDLQVQLDRPDGVHYLDLANIAPGDSGTTEMVIFNTGSMSLDYRLFFSLSGSLGEGETPLQLMVRDAAGAAVDLSGKRILSSGGQERLILCCLLPQEAGNAYQGATAELGVQVRAEQVAGITDN